MRRLTNYGKRALSRTIAVAAGLVMLYGAIMVITQNAAWYLLGQKYFNLTYIFLIMPACFSAMAYIAYAEYDKKQHKTF